MKRFLSLCLVICTALCSYCAKSAETGYTPMVVEGRIWWYNGDCQPLESSEYGIRIGETEEVRGIIWHKVELVTRAVYKWEFNRTESTDMLSCESEPVFLGYIREQDGKVFTMMNLNTTWSSFRAEQGQK